MTETDEPRSNFIREIIDADLESGRHSTIVTRFPPEPNGYLHIGHAKAICINFGLAAHYGGTCHLRFDDTNPAKEDIEYVEAIQRDIKWLGFDWDDKLFFASDYYEQLHQFALSLIRGGKAYVCSLDEQQMRTYRGTVTEAGKESPYRGRSPDENLDLFTRMRAGEFDDGAHVLRAKIDMASPNMKMRDPPLYRIRHAHHFRTGDTWCIYPLYDFAHGLSDAIEGITHSLCSLEFENNRELYDWFIDNVPEVPCRPRQYEFARLSLNYTMTSKRKLLELVQTERVTGWDDPRMPTLSAMKRRGITPASLRAFIEMIGVAKNISTVDLGKLEFCIREDLNHTAPRAMCVLDPIKVVLDNYPADRTEAIEAPSFPPDIDRPGARTVMLSREIFIERSDFMEEPPKKFHRLAPGREVRLRYGYVIKCERGEKNAAGEIIEIGCRYDADTLDNAPADGRRIKGTIHWVSVAHAVPCEVRLYDRLFRSEKPGTSDTWHDDLNPDSLVRLEHCYAESSLAGAPVLSRYQFERQGYFCVDSDSSDDRIIFNRTVTLRDSWAKLTEPQTKPKPARPPTKKKPKKAPAAGPPAPSDERMAELGPTLAPIVAAVLAAHTDEAARFKAGKTGLMGFFVGQAMRDSRGQGDPAVIAELVRRALADS